MTDFRDLSRGDATRELVRCAEEGLMEAGYIFLEEPRVKRTTVWQVQKDGESGAIAVKTTRDRWFAFSPANGGWKTLDDVDWVAVVAVDDSERPVNAQVYVFEAATVQKHFDAHILARQKAGHKRSSVQGFSNWVSLDPKDPNKSASYVGSGLASEYAPVAVIPLRSTPGGGDYGGPPSADPVSSDNPMPSETINDVMLNARQKIAAISGLPEDSIRLELHIEG